MECNYGFVLEDECSAIAFLLPFFTLRFDETLYFYAALRLPQLLLQLSRRIIFQPLGSLPFSSINLFDSFFHEAARHFVDEETSRGTSSPASVKPTHPEPGFFSGIDRSRGFRSRSIFHFLRVSSPRISVVVGGNEVSGKKKGRKKKRN